MDLGFIFPRRSNHMLRLAALGVGLGLAVMGVDAGVAHFAGRPVKSVAQLAPVIFGQLACAALVIGALLRWQDHSLRKMLRIIGIFTVIIGLAGSVAHIIGMVQALAGLDITFREVFGVAAPLAGSAAFFGMGALLVFLGNPKVSRELRSSPVHAPVAAAESAESNS